MKSVLIFNYAAVSFLSLYYLLRHLFKKNKKTANFFFILLLFFLIVEFTLIAAVNINPLILNNYSSTPAVFVFPVVFFILLFYIALFFPAENPGGFKFFFTLFFILILLSFFSIFFLQKNNYLIIEYQLDIVKNRAALSSAAAILFFMMIAPAPLILKIRYSYFRRIRTTIIYYLSGIFVSYVLLILIYSSGIYFHKMSLLRNPFIPVPFLLIIVFTDHLIFNLKNNDFQKYYKIIFVYLSAFIIFFTPVYFFLRIYPLFENIKYGSIYIKSVLVFLYLALSYRIINPYLEKYRSGKLQQILHAINKTLLPVNELKKFSDMDTFWDYITNDNFQNLKYTLGIQSAYFMLINRKENVFQFTYGYGPDPDFQVLDAGSNIADFIISHDGVFEKSFLIAENPLKKINQEILNFFNSNNIEISMVFKNMSDNITGFLLLGKIAGNKSYTADHLAALEIFRIKIQNLLITGLILDEVTAEQVAEHDKIVVSTVKKRIIPTEMASIPGVRISSVYFNNSSYGGNYFDSVKISDDKSIIFISETSYSGIDSALIGMELFSILHSRTLIFNSPEKILNTMNQVIRTSRLTSGHARCSCVIISSDGNFSYANAAHNPLLIFEPDNGNFTDVETENIPLGMEMGYRYSFSTGKLKEGSIGVLYSDGLFSSCNDAGETFSAEKLKEKIIRYSKETPAVITRELYSAYKSFIGGREQTDDVTIIVFKRIKTENEQH